ncbi:MAG: hypothetical protein KatS3mg032_0154 [Cyclobacteriaceae bacterium]|nr:MAG: hypothetical protein KatS3mg032_0154 [Cyclobacteriaceae bacterium]
MLFKQGTPELLPESYEELDRIAEFLKANPGVEIELSGHTDNRGSYRALMDLSQKRVNQVKELSCIAGHIGKAHNRQRLRGHAPGGKQRLGRDPAA